MAKSKDTSSAEHGETTVPHQLFETLSQWNAARVDALNWFDPHVLARMSGLGAEWFAFVAERIREDVALQHAILHAKSAAEVQTLQIQFLQTAIDQYAAETGRLMALGTQLFDPDTKDAEDAQDNVNI